MQVKLAGDSCSKRHPNAITVFITALGRRKLWDDESIVLADDFYQEMTKKLDARTTSSEDFARNHSYWVKGE